MQIPIAFAVSVYEAVCLYKGRRKIASLGDQKTNFRVHQLVLYCFLGIVAGVVGGLLGLGGGFIMGPLFLELGIPPQVYILYIISNLREERVMPLEYFKVVAPLVRVRRLLVILF